MRVRPIVPADRSEVAGLVARLWGDDVAVAHGVVFRPADLPGFLAVDGDAVVGLLTYTRVDAATVEIVTIDALERARGVGTALLDAMAAAAAEQGARRIVLTTTNDNVDALRFYQRRGFRLTALRPGELARSRELKPVIPLVGDHGIPLTDELELTRELEAEDPA